jgi:hypothetical protein
LGLGTTGFADLKRLGLPLNFTPDSLVNEEGGRIQDSAHEGVRPFTGEELVGLFQTGSCIDCHPKLTEQDRRPSGAPGSLREADRLHHEAIGELLSPKKE